MNRIYGPARRVRAESSLSNYEPCGPVVSATMHAGDRDWLGRGGCTFDPPGAIRRAADDQLLAARGESSFRGMVRCRARVMPVCRSTSASRWEETRGLSDGG